MYIKVMTLKIAEIKISMLYNFLVFLKLSVLLKKLGTVLYDFTILVCGVLSAIPVSGSMEVGYPRLLVARFGVGFGAGVFHRRKYRPPSLPPSLPTYNN